MNPAAFSMWLAPGMREELPKHFAPTLHHSLHSGITGAPAVSPFPSATPLRSIRANRHPSTPRSCSPSFAGCPPPTPTGILLRSTRSFSYQFPARSSRRRVRSLRGPCARRRASVLSPIRCLLAHPPTAKFLRCPSAACPPLHWSAPPASWRHLQASRTAASAACSPLVNIKRQHRLAHALRRAAIQPNL